MYKIEESGDNVGTNESKPKNKKRYNPPSGYKLGDVFPKELRDKAYAYRRRLKSAKLRESINKGDQFYVKRQDERNNK